MPAAPVVDRASDPARAWFSVKAIVVASLFAPLMGGVLMIAVNYLAQQRRVLAVCTAVLAFVVLGPLLWAIAYTVRVLGYNHSPAAATSGIVSCVLLAPLIVWALACWAQGPEIADRLRWGLPMRSGSSCMLAIAAGWALLILDLALLIGALRFFRMSGG
ncbi:hypothetical protein [Lysobacter sp. CA199]|uniref:hypothetical protein n=1 Tax=Lysobacter sp. CA199 TaxID=3455608 RepID=UPI003F8D4016